MFNKSLQIICIKMKKCGWKSEKTKRKKRNKSEKKKESNGTSPTYVTFSTCMWLKNSFYVAFNIARRAAARNLVTAKNQVQFT